MMTKEDYETRMDVATQMRELARKISPVAVELADLGIAALNEQWQRATAELIKKEFLQDHRRLQWMIDNEAQVWKHPAESFYTCGKEVGYPNTCWYGNTARQAIDEAMKAN